MQPIVGFDDCRRDSPKFRAALEEAELDIDQLESKLEKVEEYKNIDLLCSHQAIQCPLLGNLVKLCFSMVDAGKTYMASKVQFINGIWELFGYFKDDSLNEHNISKLIHALQEMDKYQSILIDQARRTICTNLNHFVQSDIRKTKETKKVFEKVSDELDAALLRNSQAAKSKAHECEEASLAVTVARHQFEQAALDYVVQVSRVQAKKRHEVLDTLLSYTHAHTTFFHQGTDLCQDVDPFLRKLAQDLSQVRDETARCLQNMSVEDSAVDGPSGSSEGGNVKESTPEMEGYLFKRTSNTFKSWKRRWFVMRNHRLVYRKRCKDDALTVMEEDLKLCSVKPVVDVDRRFCFELLSPSKPTLISRRPTVKRKSLHAARQMPARKIFLRSHVLQADSEEMYSAWVSSLQAGIDAALHQSLNIHQQRDNSKISGREGGMDLGSEMYDRSRTTSELNANQMNAISSWEDLLTIPGNDRCCDCGSAQPQWASINLGITLCIECSGIHRSLGVHHSKVRSLRLDDWDPDLVKLMKGLGNEVVNRVYEAEVDERIAVKPKPDSTSNVREAWMKAKYVQRSFVKKPSVHLHRNAILRRPAIPSRANRSTFSSIKETPPGGGGEEGGVPEGAADIPGGIRREKKYSLSSSNSTELLAKRVATYFDDGPCPSASLVSVAAVPHQASPSQRASREGTEAAEGKAEEEEWCSDEDEVEDVAGQNLILYRSSGRADLQQMCSALAHGADPNWANADDELKCAIHKAIESGSVVACEYLFLNGARMDTKDSRGRTPLHLASDLGLIGQVCLLLRRGVDQKAKDKDDKDALFYAVTNANADIVTLLRLAKLNEEMKETEFGTLDETFNEVVRDFSQRASSALGIDDVSDNKSSAKKPPSVALEYVATRNNSSNS